MMMVEYTETRKQAERHRHGHTYRDEKETRDELLIRKEHEEIEYWRKRGNNKVRKEKWNQMLAHTSCSQDGMEGKEDR